MRDLAGWLPPALAVALALWGCSALEARAEPASPGMAPGAGTGTASAPAEASREILPEDRRLRVNLLVFGISYHPDRKGSRAENVDNELNLGLGLNYAIHRDDRGAGALEAGFYYDSGRNWATFAGGGYQYKLGGRWRLGGDLLVIHSETYNDGNAFLAPIPRLTYDFSNLVQVHAIYVPKYERYNTFAVYGFYITVPIWK